MRRVWLRGRENIQKRYLIHVAGYNLGLIMRLPAGAGTPREFRKWICAGLFAPSNTPVALTPSQRSAATTVEVFQWPCSTAATKRWARGVRP